MNNKDYNTLLSIIIEKINENINSKYLEKLNINIDKIKNKKELKIQYLTKLEEKLIHLDKLNVDNIFKSNLLSLLKIFLIYGKIISISENFIKLQIANYSKPTELKVKLKDEEIKYTITHENYHELGKWKKEDNNSYTYYKSIEEKSHKDPTNNLIHDINISSEFHGFDNNKEIISRTTSTHNRYSVDKETKNITRVGFDKDNYKETTYYLRENGIQMKIYKKTYRNKTVNNELKIREYKITEDFHQREKYINPNGHYKDFGKELYKDFLKRGYDLDYVYKKVNRKRYKG